MLPFQPTSESCLIGCYNSDQAEPDALSRQVSNRDGGRNPQTSLVGPLVTGGDASCRVPLSSFDRPADAPLLLSV